MLVYFISISFSLSLNCSTWYVLYCANWFIISDPAEMLSWSFLCSTAYFVHAGSGFVLLSALLSLSSCRQSSLCFEWQHPTPHLWHRSLVPTYLSNKRSACSFSLGLVQSTAVLRDLHLLSAVKNGKKKSLFPSSSRLFMRKKGKAAAQSFICCKAIVAYFQTQKGFSKQLQLECWPWCGISNLSGRTQGPRIILSVWLREKRLFG